MMGLNVGDPVQIDGYSLFDTEKGWVREVKDDSYGIELARSKDSDSLIWFRKEKVVPYSGRIRCWNVSDILWTIGFLWCWENIFKFGFTQYIGNLEIDFVQDARYWDCEISFWFNNVEHNRVRADCMCVMFGIWSVELSLWRVRSDIMNQQGYSTGFYKRERKVLKSRGYVV